MFTFENIFQWKNEDLGAYHYPRHLTKAYCESPCREPPLICKDKFIVVSVLLILFFIIINM